MLLRLPFLLMFCALVPSVVRAQTVEEIEAQWAVEAKELRVKACTNAYWADVLLTDYNPEVSVVIPFSPAGDVLFLNEIWTGIKGSDWYVNERIFANYLQSFSPDSQTFQNEVRSDIARICSIKPAEVTTQGIGVAVAAAMTREDLCLPATRESTKYTYKDGAFIEDPNGKFEVAMNFGPRTLGDYGLLAQAIRKSLSEFKSDEQRGVFCGLAKINGPITSEDLSGNVDDSARGNQKGSDSTSVDRSTAAESR